MLRLFFCLSMLAGSAFAQADKAQADLLKKESESLQFAVDEAVGSAVPGRGYLQFAKATYLEGYGIIVTFEASLAATRTPFGPQGSPEEIRTSVQQRRKDLQQKLENIFKQKLAGLKSLGPDQSLSIVMYLVNSNPADLPDLPAQVVLTAKKQDPAHVVVKEY